MLWAVIKKEFLAQVLRSQFLFSSVIILVLIVLGVGMLLDDHAEDLQDRQENEAFHRQKMQEAEDLDAIIHTFLVERPIATLRPIASGSELGRDPTIQTSHRGVVSSSGAFEENPIHALFPRIDLVFIVGVFLSLVVFVLSYDSISGEREDGTLRLVFSYNLPRDTFLLGKWLGGLLSLIVPLIGGFVVASILMLTASSVDLGRDEWLAIGAIFVLSLLYVSLMYAFGLFVSSRVRQSSTAISILLFSWVLLVLVIPNSMPYVAAIIRPLESPSRIQERLGIALADVDSRHRSRMRQMQEELGRDSEQYLEWRAEAERDREDAAFRARESIMGPYRNEKARFSRVAMGLSRLSPLAIYTYGATRLAQTGPGAETRVDEALERLRGGLSELHAEVEVKQGRGRRGDPGRDDREPPNLDLLPTFQYEPEPIAERLAGVAVDAALLAALNVLFFLGTYVTFLRMELVQ